MQAELPARLRALEDELAIRNLVARFADAVNERDYAAFRTLWTGDGVWEIGPPRPLRAAGTEAIVAMLQDLMRPWQLFMQMAHSGVIEPAGHDAATARFVIWERGRNAATFYDNLAVYRDDVVRTPAGWRFARRRYEYRLLADAPFPGQVLPIGQG